MYAVSSSHWPFNESEGVADSLELHLSLRGVCMCMSIYKYMYVHMYTYTHVYYFFQGNHPSVRTIIPSVYKCPSDVNEVFFNPHPSTFKK